MLIPSLLLYQCASNLMVVIKEIMSVTQSK